MLNYTRDERSRILDFFVPNFQFFHLLDVLFGHIERRIRTKRVISPITRKHDYLVIVIPILNEKPHLTSIIDRRLNADTVQSQDISGFYVRQKFQRFCKDCDAKSIDFHLCAIKTRWINDGKYSMTCKLLGSIRPLYIKIVLINKCFIST